MKGARYRSRISAAARAGGVRLIGPNCFGVINAHAGLNASIGIGLPTAGAVSLFTQSGAYGMAAFSRSKEEGIGFAKVIAPGNKADLNETEIVTYLGNDPDTRVIAMLLESISDGAAFLDAVRAVTSVKAGDRAQDRPQQDCATRGREPYGCTCRRLSDYGGGIAPGGSPIGRGRTQPARRRRGPG